MQGNLTIVGVKQFNDTLEGTRYDHTKLIVLLPFPRARAASNIGFNVVEAPYGTHANYDKFKNLKFPATIDAEYEVTTKGIEIFEVKLIQNPAQK